jgi:5-methylcytosine-specific restriction endonuclease McrBC GTP-binding regulatory subunit McrB
MYSALDLGDGNTLFLSVRPDWHDSKSLVGYFNPLTGTYQSTDFLRFVQQAARDFSANGQQAAPWFVVLDEMNLAHVEYYFADLLSVLESGRDEQGWTREKLRLSAGVETDGDAPPDLTLPPNLYIVGTVNIDETTHAFSPKVLDRAFSIELTEVDFSDYPPAVSAETAGLTDAERQALLHAFTRGGRFARIDKTEIATYVGAHPEARDQLQMLNAALTPFTMHFGYRVFDEIVTFLAAAEENKLFDDLGPHAAFDAAVLMKVLPKFHGSRRKLDAPLRAVLGWCGGAWPEVSDSPQPRFPRTAARVQRMLRDLEIDGFTAFG